MLIKEQKYSNKNRFYYRGLRKEDLSYKKFDEIYLTNNFIYALAHSKISGTVNVYTLKETANIFNMKSKSDEGKLRKYCQKNPLLKNYTYFFEKLKDNDWSYTLKGDYARQFLIEAIKKLGYDGYFNYEIDKEYYDEIKKYDWAGYSSLSVHSPSVCIFNEDSLIKVDSLSGDKLLKSDFIKKIKKSEEEVIKSNIKFFIENTFKVLRNRILTLSDEELKDAIKKYNKPEIIKEQEERIKKYTKALEQRIKGRSLGKFI